MNFLEVFRDWKGVEEHRAKTVIFSEGDPAEVIYVILSGRIVLTLHGESLGSEEAGGIIGEMAMIDAGTNSATATALTSVKLARLDRDQFRELIGKNAEFSLHAMAVLANRLRAIDKYISRQFELSN